MSDYCENCEAGLKRVEVLENKLAKANEDWQIRNNDACHAESRVKELEGALKLISGCWCARMTAPDSGRPPQDPDAVIEKVIEIAESALKKELDGNGRI